MFLFGVFAFAQEPVIAEVAVDSTLQDSVVEKKPVLLDKIKEACRWLYDC
jgi:hypothetical protein